MNNLGPYNPPIFEGGSTDNKFKFINFGVAMPDLDLGAIGVARNINNLTQPEGSTNLTISADEIPVFFGVVFPKDRSPENYKGFFVLNGKGKGTYGINGNVQLLPSDLERIEKEETQDASTGGSFDGGLIEVIQNDPNAHVQNLGEIGTTNINDYLNTNHTFVIGSKTWYFDLTRNGKRLFYVFTGTPGTYGSGATPFTTANTYLMFTEALPNAGKIDIEGISFDYRPHPANDGGYPLPGDIALNNFNTANGFCEKLEFTGGDYTLFQNWNKASEVADNVNTITVNSNPNEIPSLDDNHLFKIAILESGKKIWKYVASRLSGDRWVLIDGGINYEPSINSYTIQDEITYSGSQFFDLDFDAIDIVDVFVNMKKLSITQYNYTYNKIEILDQLEGGANPDVIFIKYTTPVDMSEVYGVKKDKTHPAPDWERVGQDMTLHASLPVQSRMRRCLLLDDGTVNYYLDANDSTLKEDGITPSILDGTDGQYMVEIPRHFRRFDTYGNMQYVWISEKPFPSSQEIKTHYVSVGKAAIQRSTSKLSCVVSNDVDYRGGNNNAALDLDPQTQLGKPVTATSRINFHTYAKNRGENWYMMEYEVRKTIAWLITVEYATTHHQKAVDNTLTPEGYKKGCLGIGLTNLSGGDWSGFNGYYPLANIGSTNSLGNNTGEVALDLNDYPTNGESRTYQVNSYRGVENFFGDLWEWTNGINIERTGGGTVSNIYKSIGNSHSDIDYEGYKNIGLLSDSSGYVQEVTFGIDGDITPSKIGASSTTYYSDYFYMNSSDVLRGLLFGGHAHYGASAGSFCANSHYAPSLANAYVGSRLCFLKR